MDPEAKRELRFFGDSLKRQAELAGAVEAMHEKLRKVVLASENMDATIVQFDPGLAAPRLRALTSRGFGSERAIKASLGS
jgi:hypothetical protein